MKGSHRKPSATTRSGGHTFSASDYLRELMAELDRAAISTRIAEARDKRAGLTQPELADLVHVHWRTVQDWESPKNQTVPWDRLDEIAQITGVTKDWLLHGEEQIASIAVDPERFEGLLFRLDRLLAVLEAERRERSQRG